MTDIHTLTALQVHNAFKQGKLSASEIVAASLARITQHDPKIKAFLRVFTERAGKNARMLDEKRASGAPLGKLAGIPIALKDNINLKGEITTCGSKILEHFQAPFNATASRLLEQEDAIIIGKTNCDEFAMGSSTEHSAFQKTSNPWNLSCTPGGSSGGSAAAVAARLCPLTLGSDTGGSIRQPASLCGIVGFKPTYGRVSRYGLVAFGSSLDQIGPLAATVEDIAMVMEVLGRHCEHDSTSLPKGPDDLLSKLNAPIKGMKIGVPWEFLENLQPELLRSFQASLDMYKDLGATLVPVDLSCLKYAIAVYYIIATAEASTNLSRFDGIRYGLRSKRATTLDEIYDYSRQEGFGDEVKRRIMLGTFVLSAGYQEAYYRKAQKVRAHIIQKYNEAFSHCAVIATPTSPFPAFQIGSITDPLEMYLADIYTIGNNLAGIPGISIPSGFTQDMKPIGLQLSAPELSEGLLLQAAHALQQVTSYHTAIPKEFL